MRAAGDGVAGDGVAGVGRGGSRQMSQLSRVWMAATVAVVNGHADQGCKLKSAIRSFHHSKQRISSSAAGSPADLRPLSCANGSDLGGFVRGEERRNQADDSLRQVMYLSCWGPSS
ncbi:hypothetical protein RHGRI_017801 [Rhododendron griersonianum]|uniref:Uncharacterized protein n=1 Tax=Rhododendron griersonianum TaxID=479676 RepID=A0AAV6JZ41_9ERIC|nr:hypothetical protein RHGRI_017801 [Rhododendron griersonianum]